RLRSQSRIITLRPCCAALTAVQSATVVAPSWGQAATNATALLRRTAYCNSRNTDVKGEAGLKARQPSGVRLSGGKVRKLRAVSSGGAASTWWPAYLRKFEGVVILLRVSSTASATSKAK